MNTRIATLTLAIISGLALSLSSCKKATTVTVEGPAVQKTGAVNFSDHLSGNQIQTAVISNLAFSQPLIAFEQDKHLTPLSSTVDRATITAIVLTLDDSSALPYNFIFIDSVACYLVKKDGSNSEVLLATFFEMGGIRQHPLRLPVGQEFSSYFRSYDLFDLKFRYTYSGAYEMDVLVRATLEYDLKATGLKQ
jgi:hypothetical protein